MSSRSSLFLLTFSLHSYSLNEESLFLKWKCRFQIYPAKCRQSPEGLGLKGGLIPHVVLQFSPHPLVYVILETDFKILLLQK